MAGRLYRPLQELLMTYLIAIFYKKCAYPAKDKTFVQRRPNIFDVIPFDVSPTLYKCYTDVLSLLGTAVS